MEQILTKYGYLPVSESDLHHVVAQAIMAGLPDSRESPELITGLRYAREDDTTGLHWALNPRFAHMILPPIDQEALQDGDNSGATAAAVVPIRTQLASATTMEEAQNALETAFGAKLTAMLQMDADAFQADVASQEVRE